MYFYRIGFYSYEESNYLVVFSEKKYTKEEFNKLVIDIAAPIVLEQQKKNVLQVEEDIAEFKKENLKYDAESMRENAKSVTWDSVYREVAEVLCLKYGFNMLEYQAEFSLFSWSNIIGSKIIFEREQTPEFKALKIAVERLNK